MSSFKYFRFFPQEYLSETAALTKAERAYFALLIIHMHACGVAVIPTEDAKRALGMKAGSWRNFLATLVRTGCIEIEACGRLLRQPGVASEIKARAKLSAARSAAGNASARARIRRRLATEAAR